MRLSSEEHAPVCLWPKKASLIAFGFTSLPSSPKIFVFKAVVGERNCLMLSDMLSNIVASWQLQNPLNLTTFLSNIQRQVEKTNNFREHCDNVQL